MTVVTFTVCFMSRFMICVMCQRGLFISGVCPESSYVTLSLLKVNSTVFLGFLIYCIVWGMPKIHSWRYRGLSIGRRANHTAASFQHCLHGGGFDGCLGLAGHTPVAHVDLNVFCCVLWLLNCYIKYFYKTIFKFLSLCLFFLHSNLNNINRKFIRDDTLWMCLKGPNRIYMNEPLKFR